MRWKIWVLAGFMSFMFGCNQNHSDKRVSDNFALPPDSLARDSMAVKADTGDLLVNRIVIRTGNVQPQQVVDFAKTLIGTRYKYGSTDPAVGFDCSGFITYVFRHFDIQVPRSSIDFTEVGRTVDLDSVKAGDIILFTGTDSTERFVGHMGIITSNQDGQAEFIHSTSGKQFGVTITPLNGYYLGRFIRVARVFPQNEQ
jgi:cell wall-associated NlpC family hydrolase